MLKYRCAPSISGVSYLTVVNGWRQELHGRQLEKNAGDEALQGRGRTLARQKAF
jgi:hypothetical protein